MREDEAVRVVFEPFQEMWQSILRYLPSLAGGLLILLLGAIVYWLVKRLVVRVLLIIRIDRPLRGLRWTRSLRHADVRHALANAIGETASAFVFLIFLSNALTVWRLEVLSRLIGDLVAFVPKLVVGGLVMLFGSIIASIVADRVRLGLDAEGLSRAGLAARLVRWGLTAIVAALTLEQLGIAPRTVQATVWIGLGTLGLTTVLAIGLGSGRAVTRFWDSFVGKREPLADARDVEDDE